MTVPLSPEQCLQTVARRPGTASDQLAVTAERAKQYAEQSRARNTKRAYKADWSHFATFCERHDLPSMPAAPETIGLYMTALAESGYRASTIQRRLSALREAHPDPGPST
jgi:site-specific recombinase XerD